MCAASPRRPSRPRPSLAALAQRFEAAAAARGRSGRPLLLGIGDRPDGAAVAVPVPPVGAATDDPVGALLGVTVASACSGVAVVAQGTGRRLPGVDRRTDPTDRSLPYRFAYVLDREGRAGCAVRAPGGAATVEQYDDAIADGPGGRLVDVCHRAVGRPTAPPPFEPTRLWLLSWLDLLLARALDGGAPTSWTVAVRSHPALTLLAATDGQLPVVNDLEAEALGRMGRALGRARSWDRLRRSAAAGDWTAPGIGPGHARWMDDGMFARWVGGEYLPVAVYLAELADILPASVADRVAAAAELSLR